MVVSSSGRRWCFSTDDGSIQLGRRSSSSTTSSQDSATPSTAPGCCPIFGRTTTIWREKWRRLVVTDRLRPRHRRSSASPTTTITCVPAEMTEVVVPCSYDRWSYEQNFDRGSMMWDDEEEIDNLSRSFSMRFAHPSSRKNTPGSSFFVGPPRREETAQMV